MKKNLKSVLAILLSLATLLSLAACGSKTGGEDTPQVAENPEYTYVATYNSFSSGDFSYYPALFDKDGYYSTQSEKIGERELMEGETLEWEGQLDIYGQTIYFIGYDGTVNKLENYASIQPPENEDSSLRDYSADTYVNQLFLAGDNLAVLEVVYESWNGAPKNITPESDDYWNYYCSRQSYYIRTLDKTGAELTCVQIQIPEGIDEGYFYLQTPVILPDGRLITSYSDGGNNSIYIYGMDGKVAKTIPMDTYVDRILLLNGDTYVMTWVETLEMKKLDVETGTFGESVKLPNNAYDPISGDDVYDLYFNDYNTLSAFDMETGETTKLLNWIDCDVDAGNLTSIQVQEDGTVVAFSSEYDMVSENWKNNIITLEKKPYDSVPHKTELTLATQGLNWDVRTEIINFNRTNPDYRIVVKDYSEYNTDENYTAGLTKLRTEILAGTMPDILDLSGFNVDQLAQRGLLMDLYPLIDADGELKREDYFPNVLATMEFDGKLCSTVSNFSVMTLIGSSAVVGDKMGWTYDEFNAALASMPEGCTALDEYTTREDILRTCLCMDMDSYVNWATGECNFDSDSFKKLLAFANSFPAEYDWDNYEYIDTAERIKSGMQMLVQAYVYDFNSLLEYPHYFNGDITFVGYPSDSGTGSMFSMNSGYGITSKCSAPEAAWQFLRTFFTADFQLRQYSLPSNINAYNKMEKDAMTPEYMKDENGNILLDENGEKIMISRGGYGWGNGEDDFVEIFFTSEEDAQTIRELIAATTKLYSYETDSIFDIVSEQATAYFAGQKSADEVAKLIQSKANIFVNEQR